MGERLGVLGGTFDPVHVGHLVAAVNVRHALALDRVLLMVANEPWQKTGTRPITDAGLRLGMVEAAVDGVDGVEAGGLEIERGGTTYTADTLATLGAEDANRELFLVVGADVAGELDTWERSEEIRAMATLVVVSRGGVPAAGADLPGWRTVAVEIPAIDLSSTELRKRAAAGKPLEFLVPAPALHFIRERGLYPGSG